jgi:hypothetical protein
MQSLMTCSDLFEELRMPMEGNAPRAKAVRLSGRSGTRSYSWPAENVLPDVVLRDAIIALDKFMACGSQPGHFLGSRELLLVDIELALGVISLVRRS